MKKPILIIMAAGMGSRYGGLKQIDPVDEQGHIIMDFSIYDAVKAGFEKVIFIIKKELEQDFKEKIGNRMEKRIAVEYVYQDIANLPDGFAVPEGRVKPWGTAHAVLSCLSAVDGPFAVINADDYYGKEGFKKIHDYMVNEMDEEAEVYDLCMGGFMLANTLSENGGVTRGVCRIGQDGYLKAVTETYDIQRQGDGLKACDEQGNPVFLDGAHPQRGPNL